MQTIYNKLCLL